MTNEKSSTNNKLAMISIVLLVSPLFQSTVCCLFNDSHNTNLMSPISINTFKTLQSTTKHTYTKFYSYFHTLLFYQAKTKKYLILKIYYFINKTQRRSITEQFRTFNVKFVAKVLLSSKCLYWLNKHSKSFSNFV